MNKKSKIAPEIHEYFDDYNPGNVTIMIDFMKMQHNCALELTKLGLDNCKWFDFNKEGIFTIFQEAMTVVGTSIKDSSREIISKKEGCEVCGE